MAQEINLGGTIYVSSKRAAENTGYAQDYIGQLARSGQIEARRVAGLWYVLEDSLRAHKHKADEFTPTPPVKVSPMTPEASVNFDGKEYISASRAAKITGYAQDYVGQLARAGKIPSRQIGNRWYVDRAAITEHKRHNDALLGAVQAESVGIARTASQESSKIDLGATQATEPHFNYIAEVAPILPIEEVDTNVVTMPEPVGNVAEEEERQIPIRVVAPVSDIRTPEEKPLHHVSTSAVATSRITMFSIAFLGILVFGAGVVTFIGTPSPLVANGVVSSVSASRVSTIGDQISQVTGTVAALAGRILAKEIEYQRDR